MSWTYSDEYYKNYTRDTWNEAAAAYEAGFGAQMASIGHALLADLAVTPNDSVLDLATGPASQRSPSPRCWPTIRAPPARSPVSISRFA